MNLFSAHIKDPNNVQHNVQHLRVGMVDMNSHVPTPASARKIMNDAVSNEQPQMSEGSRGNVLTVGDYDLQLSCMYRTLFDQLDYYKTTVFPN